MNKAYIHIIVIIFTLFSFKSVSQNIKIGLVYYGHIESPGMGSAIGKDLNSYLTFDLNKSYYVTAKDSLENIKTSDGGDIQYSKNGQKGVIKNGGSTTVQGNQVFYDRLKNIIWWNKREGGQKYVKEIKPQINWKLLTDKKNIGKFSCKKATGFFRGRTYTAWYTDEIPLPYGPDKLQGLPGLILEAYDTDKEAYYYFKSLQYPSKQFSKVSFIKQTKDEGIINWWTINQFIEYRKKNMLKANNRSILDAKENNWPNHIEIKMIEGYIESFE